jgi:hypothetical protein
MAFLTRRTHGILDYVAALILILSPKLFGFERGEIDARIPVILGVAALVYSLITNYELGLFKLLPFRAHLMLDVLSGVVLAASPWLFQFADRIWWPHLLLGLLQIGVVMMTNPASSEQQVGGPPASGAHL